MSYTHFRHFTSGIRREYHTLINTTPLYMIKRVCINSRKKRKGNERIARFQRQ